MRQVLDDPLGTKALEHVARERGADGDDVRAGGDTSLDSAGGVLDDEAWLLAVASCGCAISPLPALFLQILGRVDWCVPCLLRASEGGA